MKLVKKILNPRRVALVMALIFMLPLLISPYDVEAVTQAEIDALAAQAKDIATAQAELKSQLSVLSNDMDNATARKKLIEQEIVLLNQEISNTEKQIEAYDGLILLKVEEIQAAELEERKQYALFCERVRTMEESGGVTYWSILFESSDFSDLLDRIIMVDEIMEYDNQVMDNLIEIRLSIIREREYLEGLRVEQQGIYTQQQQAKAEKVLQEAEVDKLIAQIAAKEAQLQALQQELASAAASMDAEIKKKEAELAAQLATQNTNIASESGFMWPLPGYNTLSSLFGSRPHPITGISDNHTGIDVPAPSGTPILASKSGIVLTSAYHYSYGNYVVVSHSNGQSTLYAHMVSRNCVEGDVITQGQTVGFVGTTGSSTGNHLHFEIRTNGVRYDPANYFSGLYVRSGGVVAALT